MEAYFLSHNGMGDNLYSVGALRFLLNYYDKIYFLCKDIYYENIRMFFIDTDKIICVPINTHNNEFQECYNIIINKYDKYDIFICGPCHTSYLKSKITNRELLLYNNKKTSMIETHTIDYDMINSSNYSFIEGFYNDINLDLSIFFNYFELPSLKESKQLYDTVKHYNIIFLQTSASGNQRLNIKNLLNKYLHDEKTILISNDENLYENVQSDIEHIHTKKQLCHNFIKNKIIYYLDTIKNCSEIYIIDSCFVGIILPLKKMNKLKANIVRIILRGCVNDNPL